VYRGSSLWFSSFALVVCALCLSIVLSLMCRDVSLAQGVQDLSSSSDLALCLFLAFDHLLEFILFVSFLFLFSQVTICVCCQCTNKEGD
jgi:hypothetical protein